MDTGKAHMMKQAVTDRRTNNYSVDYQNVSNNLRVNGQRGRRFWLGREN